VAAEERNIAEEAVGLIEIKYEPSSAVFDPSEAMRADAPLIHPQRIRSGSLPEKTGFQTEFSLVVRPDIRIPGALSGKRLGVQSIGGTLWMYAMLALEQFGLDATRDRIHILVIGDQTVLGRALETHLIDATIFTSSTYSLSLRQQGFPVLAELTPSMATTGIVVNKSYLQRNSETLENVMKALMEGLTFILAPGNKFHVVKTIMGRLKISDPSLAEEGYADVVRDFEPKPYPSIEGLRSLQRLMQLQNPRLANINPANLIDSTFIRKLDESGFIRQLQARYWERQ